MILALSGGELVYFELEASGQLVEVEKKELSSDIACLDVGPVPEGRQRCRFLVVGSFDNTVRVFSLDPDNCLGALATQAVAAPPESLLLLDTGVGAAPAEDDAAAATEAASLFLNIGLQNGVLLRTEVDRVTGQLSDTRTRFLGARAPKLFATVVRGQQAMVALSTRPWLGYMDAGRFILAPLSYEALEGAAAFASEQCPEGLVAISGNSLRIVSVERLGETFNQTSCKLRYTPRQCCAVTHDGTQALVVVQADHGAGSTAAAIDARATAKAERQPLTAMQVDGEEEEEEEEAMSPEEQFGAPKEAEGQWASCIQMVDAKGCEVLSTLELDGNEAALATCTVTFAKLPGVTLVAVATVSNLSFYPREATGGFIHLYQVLLLTTTLPSVCCVLSPSPRLPPTERAHTASPPDPSIRRLRVTPLRHAC